METTVVSQQLELEDDSETESESGAESFEDRAIGIRAQPLDGRNSAPSDCPVAGPRLTEDLDCPICLDVLCDPLLLPCSHIFCRECLSLATRRFCPLCRAPHPPAFDPISAPTYRPMQQLLLSARQVDYRRRLAEVRAAASRVIRLRVGNRYEEVLNPKRSKNGKHLNSHRWTAFVELENQAGPASSARSISDVVEKVHFKLAPLYTAWPSSDTRSVRVGKNPEVRQAPFEVTRVGWGYFTIDITITWRSWLRLPPRVIEHELCFEVGGDSTTHCVDIGDASERAPSTRRRVRPSSAAATARGQGASASVAPPPAGGNSAINGSPRRTSAAVARGGARRPAMQTQALPQVSADANAAGAGLHRAANITRRGRMRGRAASSDPIARAVNVGV